MKAIGALLLLSGAAWFVIFGRRKQDDDWTEIYRKALKANI